MHRQLLSMLLFGVAARGALAQDAGRVGTLVIAHGGDSLWNAQVIDAAKAARTGGPVEVSFLMGAAAQATRVQEMVARLERQGVSQIVFVPLLVSSHSGHYDQVRYLGGDSVTLGEQMLHHLLADSATCGSSWCETRRRPQCAPRGCVLSSRLRGPGGSRSA